MGVGFWYVSPMRRAAFSVKSAFLPSAKARFKKCRLFCPVPVLRLRFLYFRKSLSYQQLPEVHNFLVILEKNEARKLCKLIEQSCGADLPEAVRQTERRQALWRKNSGNRRCSGADAEMRRDRRSCKQTAAARTRQVSEPAGLLSGLCNPTMGKASA